MDPEECLARFRRRAAERLPPGIAICGADVSSNLREAVVHQLSPPASLETDRSILGSPEEPCADACQVLASDRPILGSPEEPCADACQVLASERPCWVGWGWLVLDEEITDAHFQNAWHC